MHHVYDEIPGRDKKDFKLGRIEVADNTNAIYSDHVGAAKFDAVHAQVNLTQYRSRGWKIGSLMTGPNDPEPFYKQPGHPLSPTVDKGGRYNDRKEMITWEPNVATK